MQTSLVTLFIFYIHTYIYIHIYFLFNFDLSEYYSLFEFVVSRALSLSSSFFLSSRILLTYAVLFICTLIHRFVLHLVFFYSHTYIFPKLTCNACLSLNVTQLSVFACTFNVIVSGRLPGEN